MNMEKEKIEKLPILPQGMNTKKPTWNNIRYFFRDVHYSEIIRGGKCIQAAVKGLSALHEQIHWLLEIPDSVYKNLQNGWCSLREHDRFIDKFGWHIQKIFSKGAKCEMHLFSF